MLFSFRFWFPKRTYPVIIFVNNIRAALAAPKTNILAFFGIRAAPDGICTITVPTLGTLNKKFPFTHSM